LRISDWASYAPHFEGIIKVIKIIKGKNPLHHFNSSNSPVLGEPPDFNRTMFLFFSGVSIVVIPWEMAKQLN
jgi:hypothetical protein